MSSFLPIPQCQQQEIEAVQKQLSFNHNNEHIPWPTVGNEPINEYLPPLLASSAFPALFPDGRGDPTNPSLYHDIPLGERIKHLLKYAEKKDEINQKNKEYRENNREKVREAQKAYSQKNIIANCATTRLHCDANPRMRKRNTIKTAY